MKTRETLLLAVGILSFAVLLAAWALPGAKRLHPPKEFELPAHVNLSLPRSPAEATAEFARGNLFHPLRGSTPPQKSLEAEQKTNMKSPKPAGHYELTGIFSFGSARGAVIVNMAPVTNSRAGMKKNLKRRFKEGDSLSDGYVVQKIGDRTVELMRGQEKVILSLLKKQEKKP